LDVDQISELGNYSIAAGNPFEDEKYGRPEIWVYGLRNPWRFSFDSLTGDLYIGDVGQDGWEEINYRPANTAGVYNFGWSSYEGFDFINKPLVDGTRFPIAIYGHDQGCAVTGGYVYRGTLMPDLYGDFVFGDYCSGTIWKLARNEFGAWASSIFMQTNATITSFAQDLQGELFVVDQMGWIYQIMPVST
jgi:glucose/arabinose dehydrogenase